jgi:hypothetical protein
MKYGYDIRTGRELTAKEYADKLRSINNAIRNRRTKTPSLFDRKVLQ